MSVARLVIAALLVAVSAHAQTAPPKEALDGIDPVVLLTQGKEVSGKPEFTLTRGPFDYLFASAENKALFEKSPEKFEIQLNGACARMGPGVTGNPADYAVVDGKIYIFGSDDCHKKFVAAPARFLPRPEVPMPSAAAALTQGRALVDRVVKSIGGAAALDGITTYVESSSQTQKRPTGDVAVATRTMWRFPDAIRVDRTMTMADRKMTNGMLVTPAGAWFIGQGRLFPQNAEGRATSVRDNGRQLVPLLRSRGEKDFQAASLGTVAIAGVPLDRVRIKHGPVDVTLAVDQATGLVHSVSFAGRGGLDSEVGDYVITLGDYRVVSGLKLPFSETSVFNGVADTFLSRALDSITINPALDASLFQPGTGGGL